jgi:hypothetical protein
MWKVLLSFNHDAIVEFPVFTHKRPVQAGIRVNQQLPCSFSLPFPVVRKMDWIPLYFLSLGGNTLLTNQHASLQSLWVSYCKMWLTRSWETHHTPFWELEPGFNLLLLSRYRVSLLGLWYCIHVVQQLKTLCWVEALGCKYMGLAIRTPPPRHPLDGSPCYKRLSHLSAILFLV